MAKINVNKLEKDIAKKEEELIQEFKEELEAMDSEEFKQYFRQLIKKYYEVLFTFKNNYAEYYEESINQYEQTIQLVKDLLKNNINFNNLGNFETIERLKQAEEKAYNQMNTIHFLETSYSDIIYYNTVLELEYINSTLASLLDLYKTNPSDELLAVIESSLNNSMNIVKEAKKLPVNDRFKLKDYEEEVVFKKEHSTKENAEDLNFKVFTVPVFSFILADVLDKFFSILEDLKEILPEDVIEEFEYKLNASEMLNYYHNLLDSGIEKEEALELTAYSDYLKKKNNQGFLFEIIDSWS